MEKFKVYQSNGVLKAIYPSCCTSAYCGKTDCEGCPREHILESFNKWVDDNNAVCKDPIWCPNVYTAQNMVIENEN